MFTRLHAIELLVEVASPVSLIYDYETSLIGVMLKSLADERTRLFSVFLSANVTLDTK